MSKRKPTNKKAEPSDVSAEQLLANVWQPQPGPQAFAWHCPADIIFFGGSRGGGKTDTAIGRQILGAMKHGYKWSGLFVRKNYKHFKELRRRLDELIMKGLPARRSGGDNQTNIVKFDNGAQIVFTAIQMADQLEYFQGQQYTELSVEEACQFPFVDEMIEKLKGCLRSPHGVPTAMFLTGNPGGPGHNQIKVRFITPSSPGTPIKGPEGETSLFIPSNVEDNQVLVQNDPKYVSNLKSIRDPNLRKAWLEGDWDVVAGGFFDDVWNHNKRKPNVIKPFRIPKHWDRIMGIDWGSAKPFSVGWYAISGGEVIPELGYALPRGSLVRYFEWYGCVKGRADVGLRLESKDVARRIRQYEERHQLLGYNEIDRICDPAMFKEEDGPSIAEKFADEGVVLRKGDNNRIAGWDECRNRLRGIEINREYGFDEDTGVEIVVSMTFEPIFYVFDTCTEFIRTIPILARDEKDWEDVDTDQEDHIADEWRYVCMSRPSKGRSLHDLPKEKGASELDHDQIASTAADEYDEMELPCNADDEDHDLLQMMADEGIAV